MEASPLDAMQAFFLFAADNDQTPLPDGLMQGKDMRPGPWSHIRGRRFVSGKTGGTGPQDTLCLIEVMHDVAWIALHDNHLVRVVGQECPKRRLERLLTRKLQTRAGDPVC